jgi:glycosyltransferase involved in cell wall biosynthesis
MKIAFIHTHNINDKKLWSGTNYFIYKNLVKSFENVVHFQPKDKSLILFKLFFKGLVYILDKISGRQHKNFYYSHLFPWVLGRNVDCFVKRNNVDLLISTTNTPFIYTKNKIPLVIITDATVKLLYEEYSNGIGWSKLFQNSLDRNALKVTQKTALTVVSSTATAASLINDYQIPASKIITIPFGANIENEHIEQHERLVSRDKQVNFLFIGKEWERKGGDFTVSVCDELIRMGINVHLTVVGCKVPEKGQRTYLMNFNYLDKNKEKDFNILRELYHGAHFLMVFSKAEMYGIVFCEAAAYGLPSVAFAVGGIVDIVINDKTGILLPKDSKTQDFVLKISELISKPEKYQKMSSEARKRYNDLLNWEAFTASLKSEIFKRFT